MAVAVVGERGKRAVFKGKQGRIGALGRALNIPRAHNSAYACDPAAGDEPYDIHLVRCLIEHRSAALGSIEFLRSTGPIKIVGIVDGVDHAHAAEIATRYNGAQPRDRRIKRVTVADDDVHAGPTRRIDDRPALVESEGHRLLDKK